MGNHDLSISPDEIDVTERVPFEPIEALAPERAADGTRTKLGSVPPPLPDEAIASRAWLAKLEALAHEPPPAPMMVAPTRARATLPPPSLARITLPPPIPGTPPAVPAIGSAPVIAAPVPPPAASTAEGSVATPLPVLFTTSAVPLLFQPEPRLEPEPPVTLRPADAEIDSRILSKEWLLSTEHLALQPRHALMKRALAATGIALAAGAIGFFVARGPSPAAPATAPTPAAATAVTATATATATDSATDSATATVAARAPTAAPVTPRPASHTPHTSASPRVAAATASSGVLMVATKPPCAIFVDGRATHLVTPQRSLHLPAGNHVIAFVDDHHALRGRVAIHVEPHHATKLIRDFMH